MGQTNWNKINSIKTLLRQFDKHLVYKTRDEVIENFADHLAMIFTAIEVERGLGALPFADRFPNLEVIKSAIRPYVVRTVEDAAEIEFQKQLTTQRKRSREIYTNLQKSIGVNGINKYYDVWLVKFLGENWASDLKNFGLDGKMFLRCALFDLADANGNIERSFEILEKRKATSKKFINDRTARINYRC